MRNIQFILLIVFLVFVNFGVSAEVTNTVLEADQIVVGDDGNVTATGNVKIINGEYFIKAKKLIVNQDTNRYRLVDVQEYFDGKSLKMSSEMSEISSDFSTGILSAVKILIDEKLSIHASSVSLHNGEVKSFNGISRVTTCTECSSKKPFWSFTASSAERDLKNKNIVYRNVSLEIKGFPVAWVPYIRLPEPGVDRALGFLLPTINYSSNLGSGFKLPYFIPISQSRDLLVTPFWGDKTKTIEFRYREAFKKGNIRVDGAMSNDEISSENLRLFTRFRGEVPLKFGIDFKFDAGTVTDTAYLGDYLYNDTSSFATELSFTKNRINRSNYLQATVNYIRSLDENSALDNYVTLFGQYSQKIEQNLIAGNFDFDFEMIAESKLDANGRFSRSPSVASLNLLHNYNMPYGSFLFSSDTRAKLSSFVNSGNNNTLNEEFNLDLGTSARLEFPLTRKKSKRLDYFNTKFQIAHNEQLKNIQGNYFIGSDEPNFSNIFSNRKFTSVSESELGTSYSLGFDYHRYSQKKKIFEGTFALLKIHDYSYSDSSIYRSVFNKKNVTYMANTKYNLNKNFEVSADGNISSNGEVNYSSFGTSYSNSHIKINGFYEFVSQLNDTRLNDNIKNLAVSKSLKILNSTNFSVDGRYDLVSQDISELSYKFDTDFEFWNFSVFHEKSKAKADRLSLKAIFDDRDCTRIIAFYDKRFDNIGASKPIDRIGVIFQLTPFADVNFSR